LIFRIDVMVERIVRHHHMWAKYVTEREMPGFVSVGYVYAIAHMPNGTHPIVMNTRGGDVTPGTRIADEGTLN
jgi:hypothetical protein